MKNLLALGCLLSVMMFPFTAQGGSIVVFGDSLSDTGNFSLATGGTLPPASLYYNGRFSNGPVWVEHLAEQLGMPAPTPNLVGGTNYAFNGARVAGASPYGTPDVVSQVNLYVASLGGGSSAADDLFAVWGGSNDLFFSLTGQVPYVAPSAVAADLANAIEVLATAGAKEFIVPNLPLLGQTPFFNATPLAGPLDAAASEFNAALALELAMLEADLGITIHELDVHSLFEDVIADPTAFDLTNVTDSATIYDPATGIGVAPDALNPNEYLFFDSVHPTASVHQLIGDRAHSIVTPEPASLAIWGIVGLVVLVAVRKRRRR